MKKQPKATHVISRKDFNLAVRTLRRNDTPERRAAYEEQFQKAWEAHQRSVRAAGGCK